MNRLNASVSGICFLLFFSLSFAQQDLLGNYSGTFVVEGSRKSTSIGVQMQIASVEGGNVTGGFKLIGGGCAGDYALSGKLSGDQFALRTGPSEKQGCGNVGMKLTAKGGKLTGTYGKYEIELSK